MDIGAPKGARRMMTAKPKIIRTASSCRTLSLTGIAMVFFAANSLLARLALRAGEIDAGSFAAVRIVAGAITLVLATVFHPQGAGSLRRHGSLKSGFALFTYAVAFSYAYLSLSAGTGALVLFAAVQITMLGIAIAGGERPLRAEWMGFAVAFGGLVYLLYPGLTAPSPIGVLLMALAGIAWGYYSVAAKSTGWPILATAGNFARAIPPAAAVVVAVWGAGRVHMSSPGIWLAVTSGAITSGLGYAIWYVALKDLRTSHAAIVQLTVPAITAAAGVTLLGEQLTGRLLLASGAILGGVALAILGRTKTAS